MSFPWTEQMARVASKMSFMAAKLAGGKSGDNSSDSGLLIGGGPDSDSPGRHSSRGIDIAMARGDCPRDLSKAAELMRNGLQS
jgi:hypothetical protein